jgi:UPF0716 protein FxsA
VNPWVILIVVGYPVLEWLTASWLASVIGWGAVLLTFAVLVIVGAAVMRRAGFAAARSLRPVSVDGVVVSQAASADRLDQAGREVGDAGTLFVAGFLIAVPGLLTSAAGLLLLVPPVRRAVRGTVSRSVRRRAEAAGLLIDARVASTTTVPGSVVDEPGSTPPGAERPSGEPSPGERTVRGEILSGEVLPRASDGDDAPAAP